MKPNYHTDVAGPSNHISPYSPVSQWPEAVAAASSSPLITVTSKHAHHVRSCGLYFVSRVLISVTMSSLCREVITLQLGHYSNFAGTHWWNLQVRSARARLTLG